MTDYEEMQNNVDVATIAAFMGLGTIENVKKARDEFETFKQTHAIDGSLIEEGNSYVC